MFLARLLGSSHRTNHTSRGSSGPSAATAGHAPGWWQPFVNSGLVQVDESEVCSAEAATGYHAWFRAITLIAWKCAAVPKHLLRDTGSGDDQAAGKQRARGHDVHDLVHVRANDEQTAFQFWLQMAGHVASRGNGYAAIWTVGGRPAALIPMNPDRTYPVRKNGELWYVVFPFGADSKHPGIKLRSSEVLHFKGFGFDGLCGYPVWAKAAEEIGLARGNAKLQGARYKNSGRPAMVLQTDKKLDPKARDRLRADWESMHAGLDNAGKTAVLDDGLKAQAVSMTAEDLEQAGAAQMSITAISNYTGVPASKLGATGRNYASQEQEDQAFVQDGLDFYLNVLDDEASAKLLTQPERELGYEVKSNREALLRTSLRDKFEILRIATAGKPIMTQNEARKQIDLPPAAEPDAGKLLTPLNMGQGGDQNQPNDNADDPPGRPPAEAAARQLPPAMHSAASLALRTSAKKLVKRVACHAARVSKDASKFVAFVDALEREHRDVFRAEMRSAERTAAAVSTDARPKDGEVADWLLATLAMEFNSVANEATTKTLAAKVAALVADQEVRLPKETAHIFLETDNEA